MASSLTNTIPIYQTDSEEEEVPIAVQVQRKQKRERNWNMEKVYKSKKDAIDFVNYENTFSQVCIIKMKLLKAIKNTTVAIKPNSEAISAQLVFICYSIAPMRM
jgi:hypothetical protein